MIDLAVSKLRIDPHAIFSNQKYEAASPQFPAQLLAPWSSAFAHPCKEEDPDFCCSHDPSAGSGMVLGVV